MQNLLKTLLLFRSKNISKAINFDLVTQKIPCGLKEIKYINRYKPVRRKIH